MKNLRALRKEEHGAGEWGTPELTNKYKSETPGQQDEGLEKACWKGYEAIGTKQKNGRTVPNCVPKEGAAEDAAAHRQAAHAALDKGDAETYNRELDKKFDIHAKEAEKAKKLPVKTYEAANDEKNLRITKHEKAAVEAGKKGDKRAQQWHLEKVKKLQSESVNEATKQEPQKHLVTVTVTDPQHATPTKRKEKIMKRVKVSATDPKQAVKKAEAHYKKHGFKVHDSLHHSIVKESLDTDEFIDSYDPEQKNEATDSHEAEEIAMAKGQFAEIADMAQELVDAMDDTDELEPWMHSKITTAYVNLDDVYSYIAYGDKYSTDDDSEDEKSEKKDIGEGTEQPGEDNEQPELNSLSPEEKAQIARIKTLIRLGLLDNSQMQVTLRAIKKLDMDQPVTSSSERQAINMLVQKLIGVVTGDDMVFRKIRLNVQK